MSLFRFQGMKKPFPRWLGPFSPATGTRTGFRFHGGRLGTWLGDDLSLTFWALADSQGVRTITSLVINEWGGGRVLFLPNGYVVKPLQANDEAGRRVVIGLFQGEIILERPNRSLFNLGSPGAIRPGDRWKGPTTTGLKCVMKPDGALVCTWYHPTRWGRDEVYEVLRRPDRSLAEKFRSARPGDASGSVRITANGHIITNRQEMNGYWESMYVGHVDSSSWNGWDQWIRKERI